MNLDRFFQKSPLIPAIVQEESTGQVLMLAYMNRESLEKTLETGETWFYSRSRGALWHKGETSGHRQKVQQLFYDCDEDTILALVEQTGPACHTGAHSCFYRAFPGYEGGAKRQTQANQPLQRLYQVVQQRKTHPQEGSYTCYLFEQGLDKILKKCGEECAETIIAAKNGVQEDTANEICDLLYHLTVLMVQQQIPLEEVLAILDQRSQKIGNLKPIHPSDHNT